MTPDISGNGDWLDEVPDGPDFPIDAPLRRADHRYLRLVRGLRGRSPGRGRLRAVAADEYRELVQERVEGETPAGGAYAILTFYDDAGRYAPREEATRVVIAEYDSEDRLVMESWGTTGVGAG